ncbi:MAG: A24 family peptidase [Acidobacteriaceae bacterium]
MHSIAWWPTLIVLTIATFTDVRSRRIPNWLVLPFLVTGVVASVWTYGWHGLGQSLLGMSLATLVFGLLCWMGGMGMGDLKLCAAIGAWIGPGQLTVAMVMMGIAGGIMALCWAIGGGFVGELFDGAGSLMMGVAKRGLQPHPELTLNNPITRKMPYAPAIAVGAILSFFSR